MVYHGNSAFDTDFPYACFKESVTNDRDRIVILYAVEYVAKNFRVKISLEIMAYDLCVSKYVLSRMFAKTFHCNFSKYVNGVRLNYAVAALENTMDSITNICLDCRFESQRTFNRVFKDRYKITPREYRKRMEHNRKDKISCNSC